MTQETGGAPAPVTDAPASQVEQQTEVEVAKPGSEADSSPAAKDPSDSKPPKDWEGERVKELTRHRREAERRADQLLRQNEELMRLIKSQQTPQPTQQPQPEQRKTLKDFGYDEAAYDAYKDQQAFEKASRLHEQAREKSDREKAEKEALQTYAKKAAEYAKRVEDYHDVAGSSPISDDVAKLIMRLEDGPDIAYYYGKNHDLAESLSRLPLEVAAVELGRVAARLDFERKKAAEKPVSKAPPPAPKIEGAGDGSTKAKPDDPASDADLSDAEWTRRRNAQIAARQRARS